MMGELGRINLAQDRDHQTPLVQTVIFRLYRVSINVFPDYKHLLQENYCT